MPPHTSPTELITVIIADDHPIVRAGLRMMTDKARDIKLLAEAGDGAEALEAITRLSPAVAVLDIEMPVMTGLDVLREIRRKSLPTRPIMLTLHDEADIFQRCVELGAAGYVIKDSAPHDIVRGIRRVAQGDLFLGELQSKPQSGGSRIGSEMLIALETLSAAERRVLNLIAEDRSTREIAEALFVSKRTIDSHRSSICSKLGLNGSFALIRFAADNWKSLDVRR